MEPPDISDLSQLRIDPVNAGGGLKAELGGLDGGSPAGLHAHLAALHSAGAGPSSVDVGGGGGQSPKEPAGPADSVPSQTIAYGGPSPGNATLPSSLPPYPTACPRMLAVPLPLIDHD